MNKPSKQNWDSIVWLHPSNVQENLIQDLEVRTDLIMQGEDSVFYYGVGFQVSVKMC